MLHENPPSPIDLLRLSSIKTHIPLPPLAATDTHVTAADQPQDDDIISTSFRRVSTAPGSHPGSREAVVTLDRAKTDAMREELLSGHMVTRRENGVDRFVVDHHNETNDRDVLTDLPEIQPGAKSHRNANSDSHVPRPMLLRKSTSELVLSTERGAPATGQSDGMHPRASENRDGKAHFSTSDIPETVFQEAVGTYIVQDNTPNDAPVTQECSADRHRGRKRSKQQNTLPLTSRVDDFYKRFDTWLIDSAKPKFRASPSYDISLGNTDAQKMSSKDKHDGGISLPPINT